MPEEIVQPYREGVLLARTYSVAGEIAELWETLEQEMGRQDLIPQTRHIRDEINILRHQIIQNAEDTQEMPAVEGME